MKKIYPAIIAVLSAFPMSAINSNSFFVIPDGAVTDVKGEKTESSLIVTMKINPSQFPKKSNREVRLTPAITAGGDTVSLPSVVVAGRTRYYQHLRNGNGMADISMVRSGDKESYSYSAIIPFESWMDHSEIILTGKTSGCCGDAMAEVVPVMVENLDFREKVLEPVYVYVKPTSDVSAVKERHVDGKAYIDFPVNKTAIYPDYRRNPEELAEIRRTIDEVRNDKDITITSLTFKGFASPEGPYANNERLAKGRTEALIEHVRNLYSFPRSIMHSSWEAEDWSGLAKAVESLDIDNKGGILALIDDDSLGYDEKDAMIKRKFPAQYAYLLKEVYPALRHSDYSVEYVIRTYTDVAEIAEVMRKEPQKLSYDELFLYAKSLDKDSPEFKEAMEVAVRLFPDDQEANLNAATTAVANGEYDRAREYLSKAGNTPEAKYTEGVLEAKSGNYEKASLLLNEAVSNGVKEAADVLATMKDFGWIK